MSKLQKHLDHFFGAIADDNGGNGRDDQGDNGDGNDNGDTPRLFASAVGLIVDAAAAQPAIRQATEAVAAWLRPSLAGAGDSGAQSLAAIGYLRVKSRLEQPNQLQTLAARLRSGAAFAGEVQRGLAAIEPGFIDGLRAEAARRSAEEPSFADALDGAVSDLSSLQPTLVEQKARLDGARAPMPAAERQLCPGMSDGWCIAIVAACLLVLVLCKVL